MMPEICRRFRLVWPFSWTNSAILISAQNMHLGVKTTACDPLGGNQITRGLHRTCRVLTNHIL
uniref:Uncharacterized protein n=1 Tax=Arundo donax TaxID=35708 RepID=A0A0A9B380_ARUDO